MTNYRMFFIKYIPCTDTRGSRASIHDTRLRQRVLIPIDPEDRTATDTAIRFLNSLGINIIGEAESEQFHVLFTDDFHTEIKKPTKKVKP